MPDGLSKLTSEPMARARHFADIGDVSHTVLHSQEALFGVVERLAQSVDALRAELAGRGSRE